MATALVVAGTALKVISIVTTLAKIIQSAGSGYQGEFDRLMNELRSLQGEVQDLGKTLLAAIGDVDQSIVLSDLIRTYSVSENVLTDLQLVRSRSDAAAAVLRDSIITRSGDAVTELTRITTFRNYPFPAIGFFVYGVTIRLQVLRELVPSFYKQEPFRTQIREWVQILRQNADTWEFKIRSANRQVSENEKEDCEYDAEARRVICELVSISFRYINLSGTVIFNRTYRADDVFLGRNEARSARSDGIARDIDLLGVADLRATAAAWEGIINFAAVQSLTLKVLERPITAIETATLLERPDLAEINLRRLLTGLAQTDEFRTRFVEPMEDRMEEVADVACKRLFDRSAEPEEAKLLSGICRYYGFNAMVSALISSRQYDEMFGNDLPRSDTTTIEGDPSALLASPTVERRAIDVFRS